MENKHPWLYIQQELIKRWRTQKEFAHILGKKVSEVNELIKGKRNITIQRDILLGAVFNSPAKKRITLQMEHDYATNSQLFDEQKIQDIKSRKNILEQTKWKNPTVESVEEALPKQKTENEKENITTNTVAYEKQSSTIQASQIQQNPPKDKHRSHEIFRNF
jgi:plasmid maintenance system antidote protein VapI